MNYLFNKPINERNLCHKKWSYLLGPKGLKPETSDILVDKECCNLALFFKQQVVAHCTPLVYLSLIWQETLESLGCQLNAKLNLRKTLGVLLYSSLDTTSLQECIEGW